MLYFGHLERHSVLLLIDVNFSKARLWKVFLVTLLRTGGDNGKGKVHLRTGHEGLVGGLRYSFTTSLASALDGVGGQRHASATLPPVKTRYPLHRGLGGP